MSQAPSKLTRRTIFAGAGTAGAVAAAVSLLPVVKQEPDAAAAPRPAPERGGGYSLTDHVKRYYQTTRV
jgi:hypothetical protein